MCRFTRQLWCRRFANAGGGDTDFRTLSRQIGNRAAMIERHYSKLTATMAADRLASCTAGSEVSF